MGTFTDNLLKLTEFPFSYSFIGLVLLMVGGGGFFDDASLERIGPLLILLGFAATTLSITDPIGHIEKHILLGWPSLRPRPKLKLESWKLDYNDIKPKIEDTPGFGGYKVEDQILVWVLVCLLEKFYVEESDDKKKQVVKEHWDIFDRICKKYKEKREEISDKTCAKDVLGYDNENLVPRIKKKNDEALTKKELEKDPIYKLYNKLHELKYRTSTSTWMTREVDKITSMWYFVIVIFTFIVAMFLLPSFEDRLLAAFQGGSQTGNNNSDSVPDEGTVANAQAQEEAQGGQLMQEDTTIAAIQNETTPMTGKDLMIPHIRAAIAATKTNDTHTALVEINAALEEWNRLNGESGSNQVARSIIIGLSITALIFIIFMIYFRREGLKSKAGVIFKFLVEQAAIKIDKERFDKTLGEIRQYLNEGDWDLAGIWVTRLMDEYNDFIKKSVKKGKICEEEKKDKEKKVIINWKNGEMNIEEVKDVKE
jgi:hypothetical protein